MKYCERKIMTKMDVKFGAGRNENYFFLGK